MPANALSPFVDDASLHEPEVVHSSYGRLRMHLPNWSGDLDIELAAEVMRWAGVTHAAANPLTGNLLILFQPAQTSARTLLERLSAVRLRATPMLRLIQEEDIETPTAELREHVTGAWRVVYQAMGWGSVGMAVVGAILPGIPTAPFVILAGYFFIRSSPQAHQWLRESRWFGPLLRDWEEHRAVRRSLRNAALALIAAGMAIAIWLGLPTLLTTSIVAMQVVGMVIVMSLPVIDASEEPRMQ